ncbi:MAG: acylphosphatase, partial [Nitrososphaerales archaeon]|nr:acylphosphatase [Nitrososphaerales archaeon]
VRARIIAEGDVQGVGYRYQVIRIARRLKVNGWVKNLDDGRVEILCEGDEKNIDNFIKSVNLKMPPINVERLSVTYEPYKGEFTTFRIITGDLIDEIVEGFSTGASYFQVMFSKQDDLLSKQDQMLAKQDQMLAKQDQMLAKQDEMLAKQDQMLAKQDEILSELKSLRSDLKSLFEERLIRIERDILELKAKVGLI